MMMTAPATSATTTTTKDKKKQYLFDLLPVELLERRLLSFLDFQERLKFRLICKSCSVCKVSTRLTLELSQLFHQTNTDYTEQLLKLENIRSGSSEEKEFSMLLYIIESGSHTIRCGNNHEIFPSKIFPSKIARQRVVSNDSNSYDRDNVFLKSPIERGLVTNWNEMEYIWHRAFYNELKCSPEEHPIIFLEPLLTPKASILRLKQIMFEIFNIPAIYVTNQPLMSLLGSGRTTGIGYVLVYAVKQCELAGQDVTESLRQSLESKHQGTITTQDVYRIKEKLCFLTPKFVSDNAETNQVEMLESGETVILGKELFRAPEILFQRSQHDHHKTKEQLGIHELFCDSISLIKLLPNQFCSNIVLGGGNTLIKGFTERLLHEIATVMPANSNIPINIISLPYRQHLSWTGSAIWTKLQFSWKQLRNNWWTKQEYDESGPAPPICRKPF